MTYVKAWSSGRNTMGDWPCRMKSIELGARQQFVLLGNSTPLQRQRGATPIVPPNLGRRLTGVQEAFSFTLKCG
jgi:hypothetical protein